MRESVSDAAHPSDRTGRESPSGRQMAVTAVVVAAVIVAGIVGTVVWTGTGAAGGEPVGAARLARVAALAGGCLLLFLCAFQIGLATGRVPGRMAWGGRFEILPPAQRRASAVTALLLPVMAWVLLERAAVVDVVGGEAGVGVAAWAVTVLFMLSTAANLASSSRPERRLGIPLAAAIALLGFVVAYSG